MSEPNYEYYRPTPKEVVYPEGDGEPMAETEPHGDAAEDVKGALRGRYSEDPQVQVGGNLLLYYVEGDPTLSVAPDVYVTLGVPKGSRRTWKTWVEGKAPDVVFEMTSKSTKAKDLGIKKGVYALMGVKEYFLFDPLDEYLHPRLRGYRLVGEDYVPLMGPVLVSEVLGLTLRVEGRELWLIDRETGQRVLPPRLRAEVEAQRAEAEAQRADSEAQRADDEAQRADDAEARLAAAVAELKRLRGDV